MLVDGLFRGSCIDAAETGAENQYLPVRKGSVIVDVFVVDH